MATCKYLVDVELSIYLNDEEFKLLDSCVRSNSETAINCNVGFFWYGITNSRKFHYSDDCLFKDEDYCFTVTLRQCDVVLLKALELTFTKESKELYGIIYNMCREALQLRRELNEKIL